MSSSASNGDAWRCEGNNPFCLGMEDLCGCHEKDASDIENVAPKVKKLKLSLKRPRPGSCFEHVDEEEMSEICKGYVPPNTSKNTRWSFSIFNEWKSSRNRELVEQKRPDDILECPEASKLNFWLACFVAEVRRSDGKLYPPKSIHQLICVLRSMCSVDPACPNVLDRTHKISPLSWLL